MQPRLVATGTKAIVSMATASFSRLLEPQSRSGPDALTRQHQWEDTGRGTAAPPLKPPAQLHPDRLYHSRVSMCFPESLCSGQHYGCKITTGSTQMTPSAQPWGNAGWGPAGTSSQQTACELREGKSTTRTSGYCCFCTSFRSQSEPLPEH